MMRLSALAFLLALSACSSNLPSYGFVSYRATFNAATIGNILNPNIYDTEKGPEGFVSYMKYFAVKPKLVLSRNLTFRLSYQAKGEEAVAFSGTYSSKSINAGLFELIDEKGELISTLSWLNYFQMEYDSMMKIPELGGEVKVVCLMHSADIFK